MNHQQVYTHENAQQFIATGYDPCTKGMHKTILPMGKNNWRCGTESICLANKCNSLVSASANSLDPILSGTSSSLLADDKFTVVTSNVIQLACIQRPRPSLAATARHLWGSNPVPQYLNAMTITTHMAIADMGAMSIFIMECADVANRQVAQKPLTIKLPDENKVMSTHICDINIPGLPTILMGHIVLSLAITSLMGVCPLCKAGCTVVFDNDKCDVVFNGKAILHGYKDPTTNLWTLPITNKVCTTLGPTVMP
jgi:hypothetical protein